MNLRKLTPALREQVSRNKQYAKDPHKRVKDERPAKKTRKWHGVICPEHGKQVNKMNYKEVKVQYNSRKDKTGGCPLCRAEKNDKEITT